MDCTDKDDRFHYLIIDLNNNNLMIKLELERFYQLVALQFLEECHDTILRTLDMLFKKAQI